MPRRIQPPSTAAVLAWSTLTLGAYWLFWILGPLRRAAKTGDLPVASWPWTAALVPLWVATAWGHLASWLDWWEDATLFGGFSPYSEGLDAPLSIAGWTMLCATFVYFAVQWIYLLRLQSSLDRATGSSGTVAKRARWLLGFNGFLMMWGVPAFGGMLGIAGFLGGILWVAQTRRLLAELARRNAPREELPTPGWMAA